jgi:thioredoxin reductase (NADPH)
LETTCSTDDTSRSQHAIDSSTIIVTTGVQRNQLGVPGEKTFVNKGVLQSGSLAPESHAGQHVAIIGGGDSACENALILSRAGARVTLIHRGERLSAQTRFIHEITRTPAVTLRLNTRVSSFEGNQRLERLRLLPTHAVTPDSKTTPALATSSLDVDAALIRIGWRPNPASIPLAWRDTQGFLNVDLAGKIVGQQGAFAAGEVLGRSCPSVATANGEGATAAKAACTYLEHHIKK